MMQHYIFNSNGLRFDLDHLKTIKRDILKMPVETQAEYVDQVTYVACARSSHEPLAHPFDPERADQLNATSIGNVAFVSRYHPEEIVREFAKFQLQRIKHHFGV
jgi:hypothetical protein